MRIGIYLGDIKHVYSIGDLTFELSFVNELLSTKTKHEFVFYYFGKKNIFKNCPNAKFVCLKYFKKPYFSFLPFSVKFSKIPFCGLNHRLKKDKINAAYFLKPYLHEHIEIPYFVNIRNVAHRILPHFPEFSANIIQERAEKKLNRFLTGASKIITSNKIAKNDLMTLYDVIDENIEIMPIPYPDWVLKNEEDEEFLKKHHLEKNNFIIYPAQFWTHKNHIRLILAAQVMQEQNINLKVVFTGLDRGNKKYLINYTKILGVENSILFLNYINQKELAALYKNAYAFVYPSLAGVDSVAALEAIYFNCPVLISNHFGYLEQLKKAALYFNPLDEVDIVEKIKSLNDAAIKDEIISNGKILINENIYENYINKFLNLMDSFYLTRQCWSLEENYIAK